MATGVGWLAGIRGNSFAFIMSTGILSVSAGIHGERLVSAVLLYVGILGFLFLASAIISNLPRSWSGTSGRTTLARGATGAFTIAAGTDVLSTSLMRQAFTSLLGTVLVIAMIISALGVAGLVLGKHRDSAATAGDDYASHLLIFPVALLAASVALSAYMIHLGNAALALLVPDIVLLAAGTAAYFCLNAASVVQIARKGSVARDFDGTLFINMGAAALFSLAALELIRLPGNPAVGGYRLALFMTAAAGCLYATAWLPVVAYAYFRAILSSRKAGFRISQWSIVFPLGVYSVDTYYISAYPGFHPFITVSVIILATGLAAWLYEAVISMVFGVRSLNTRGY